MLKRILFLLTFSTVLHGASDFECPSCNTCTPICNKCCKVNYCSCSDCPPCAPDIAAYNAPDCIKPECSYDVYVTASFVYFQAIEKGLQYGTYLDIDDTTNNANPDLRLPEGVFT